MSNSWEPPDQDHAWADSETVGHVPSAEPPTFWVTPPPTGSVGPAPEPVARQRRRGWVATAAAAALVTASVAVGVGVHAARAGTASATGPTATPPGGGTSTFPGSNGGQPFGFGPAGGGIAEPPTPPGHHRSGYQGLGGQPTTTAARKASTAQEVGVVDVNTVLGLQGEMAAGTGMVLTSNGEVLTNNHVISGATRITVTVVTTGSTYKASVVGYDPSQDVAVLQLVGASGLQTVRTDPSLPSVGQSVVGVGNAGGAGGRPSAVAGTVLALNQTITAMDENGTGKEQLTGLIRSDAPLAAGDSGGPLYDSQDQVVAMDTAASASGATQAFSIPIGHALSVAAAIESGQSSSTVHIGATARLGIGVRNGSRAVVAEVASGSPAASAGLVPGDVVTSVDGQTVTTPSSLTNAMLRLTPGQRVGLGWTDRSGAAHHASVTLISGPPQ